MLPRYCETCNSTLGRYNKTGFCTHHRDRCGENNSFYGKVHPLKGIPRSDVDKEKISRAKKGKPNGRLGIHLSETTKMKMRHPHNWSEDGKHRIGQAHSGNKNNCFNNWSSRLPYSSIWSKQLRDRIRVRDNFVCQECGIPEVECLKRLHIHHIDYDKKNCGESNLISLCAHCHCKVNVNREYWEVHFATKQSQLY